MTCQNSLSQYCCVPARHFRPNARGTCPTARSFDHHMPGLSASIFFTALAMSASYSGERPFTTGCTNIPVNTALTSSKARNNRLLPPRKAIQMATDMNNANSNLSIATPDELTNSHMLTATTMAIARHATNPAATIPQHSLSILSPFPDSSENSRSARSRTTKPSMTLTLDGESLLNPVNFARAAGQSIDSHAIYTSAMSARATSYPFWTTVEKLVNK